jgi:tetratricopeptide (TPR) repeat protein
LCWDKKISPQAHAAYFCNMIKWSSILLVLLVMACRNEPKAISPDAMKEDEMPAHVRELFSQTARYPDSFGLRFQLVDALDSLGAYGKAISQMDSMILRDSLNYGLWYRKALVQQNNEDTAGALQSLQYAIRIYPAPDAMLTAANLLAEKKDPDALAIVKQIDDLRLGREYEAHSDFITGVYYARTGNKKKAIEAFDACIYNNLNYLEAYMEKGFLLYDDKKTAEARKVFQTVVTIKKTYADGHYWLAKCDEALGHRTEAIANYQNALTLDPAIREAADGLKRLGAK